MHPCLHISEIVENILEEADAIQLKRLEGPWNPDEMSSSRNPVLAMALCCKAFHRMAIAVLWKDVPDLDHLYQCFPGDVWSQIDMHCSVYDYENNARNTRFKRPPHGDEWDNFLLHASMVWYLEPHITCHPGLDIQYLGVFRPPVRLFPNLRGLVWNDRPGESLYLHLFMSPKLETLECPSREDVLHVLSYCKPPLRELYLRRCEDDLGDSCHTHLSELRTLEELRIDDAELKLSVLDLKVLSGLPSLTKLFCTSAPGSVIADELWSATDASWFRSLKTVEMTLPYLQPSAPPPSAETLLLLFQAVGRLPTLAEFSLSSPIYSKGDGWETHVIDLSILRHLFAAPLRTLDISGIPFRLDDSSVRVIGWALPNLEILRLGDASEYAPSTITYSGLVAIATSCPKLKDIGLEVDLSGLTEADVTAARHPVSFSVELVSVAGIRVADPIRTTAALFLAFPCVRVRDFSASSSSHGVKVSWKQVNQHLDLHREQQTQKATVADAATDLPLAP